VTAPADPIPPGLPPSPPAVVISLFEKTRKIYPRAVHGTYARWRWALVWLTQIVFYGLPWLVWNQRQAVLFDLESRRFYLFGLVLYPQDFIYLTGLLVVSAYALFLFTAVAGRLWCGYACPQTVYTQIFLWIEHRFEGDRMRRIKLDAAPWSAEKLLRKGGKQAAWITLSLWTGFSFVGYFTPIRSLWAEAFTLGFGPWEWFWVLFYGFATYGNAGYMREQVCKYMCPYARFQSAMFDRDTLTITYDAARGDPRGARGRSTDARAAGLGDCIDCGLCVQVCPTGIDIRKGLQYECIGCAACIDVCDGVMDKMHYPRGLVRYTTENALDQGWSRLRMWQRTLRPRVLVYTAVLVLIVTGLGTSLWLRTPFKVDVVRDRASLARMVEDGWIENTYQLQIMNAAESTERFRVSVAGLAGPERAALAGLRIDGVDEVSVGPAEARWVTVHVRLPPAPGPAAAAGARPIEFVIERLPQGAEAAQAVREKSTFLLPR
jgi:cytochrome c oxidase accessory protein FixG